MSKKKPDDMGEALKRLKAAKAEEIRTQFEPGRAAGETWAKAKALPSQLKRLARRVSNSAKGNDIGTAESYIAQAGDFSPAECLCWDMGGPENETPFEYWEDILGDGGFTLIENDFFAAGFIVGALWVWEEFEASEGAPQPEPQPE